MFGFINYQKSKHKRATINLKNNNVKQPFVSSNPAKISALDDRAIETLREFRENDSSDTKTNETLKEFNEDLF